MLGSSNLGTRLTSMWQAECRISDNLVAHMLPVYNASTEVVHYKSHNEFFGDDEGTLVERLTLAGKRERDKEIKLCRLPPTG
jgi:hypothetical protein